MPALPWIRGTATAEPGSRLTVLATRLPLRKHRHIPAFLGWTLRIRGQLGTAPGLVGYSLDAHVLAKTFWTVSAWADQAAMEDFVRQDPHASAMAAVRPHMGGSTFVFWTVTPEELPVKWGDVRHRVEEKMAPSHRR
ncbi:MAG TPA: hypothetical protein VHF27_11440 [Acidimicrobiales bacterium]|nr:hypothetical protein [Acidimicrobiales bacterium]